MLSNCVSVHQLREDHRDKRIMSSHNFCREDELDNSILLALLFFLSLSSSSRRLEGFVAMGPESNSCRSPANAVVDMPVTLTIVSWFFSHRNFPDVLQPARGFACIVTLSILISSFGRFFLSTSIPSIFDNVARLSSPRTCPNTVFFPSRCGAFSKQMKNWLPFVAGPLLAILTIPRALCRSEGRISSSKGSSQIDTPPFG